MEASRDRSKFLGNDRLFRRISKSGDTNMLLTDEATGNRMVSSGAFVMDEDGCSVYIESLLLAEELGPEALVDEPQNVVISVTVETVIAADLGVHPDPLPVGPGDHRRNAAHGLIKNIKGLTKKPEYRARKALAAAAVFVLG